MSPSRPWDLPHDPAQERAFLLVPTVSQPLVSRPRLLEKAEPHRLHLGDIRQVHIGDLGEQVIQPLTRDAEAFLSLLRPSTGLVFADQGPGLAAPGPGSLVQGPQADRAEEDRGGRGGQACRPAACGSVAFVWLALVPPGLSLRGDVPPRPARPSRRRRPWPGRRGRGGCNGEARPPRFAARPRAAGGPTWRPRAPRRTGSAGSTALQARAASARSSACRRAGGCRAG